MSVRTPLAVLVKLGQPDKLHVPLKSKTTLALALSDQSETVAIPKANTAEPSNLRLDRADIFPASLTARDQRRSLRRVPEIAGLLAEHGSCAA